MKKGWILGTATAALLGLFVGGALADTAADRCAGTKMKAAATYAAAVLNCNARAAHDDTAVDAACVSKAAGKLASAFSKAEGAGGCATSGDAAAVAASVGSDSDAVVAALAHDATPASRSCAATKLKGASKHYRAVLGCYATQAPKSAAPQAVCFTKALGRLVPVFARAETKGGCTTTDDVNSILNLDVNGVRGEVASLSPVCGDGITGPTQQCETSDDATCPGLCSPACACVAPPGCGNGVAELPEQCDDGNTDPGDGCSPYCLLENASAICSGVPTTAGTALNAVLVSADFSAPIYATAPRLDPSRLFVVERAGRIRILNLKYNTIEPIPFLDISTLVSTDGERGLLSVAFDPDYETNHRFFVNYTNNAGDTTIARYERSVGNANLADPASGKILTVIAQPFANHNGGQLAFGADGYLYCGMGDGGSGGDPFGNGQNDATLLGKMLRFDVNVGAAPYWAVPTSNPHYVDGSSELELIWAKGLRNPWRFSFDRTSGELVIGDVGQDSVEEIDLQSPASPGGQNYGWNIFEGDTCYNSPPAVCPVPATGFTMPIYEYTHADGCAITGGFVYRGCAMPDLRTNYFYSDYCGGYLHTVRISGGAALDPQDRTADAESAGASLGSIVSFGEDARGEIYLMNLGGSLFRLQPE